MDLHTHILPGMDDGAKDLAMSLALLRQELRGGVRVIALTPHFSFERQELGRFLERRGEAGRLLSAACADMQPALDLRLGAEVRFSPHVLDEEARALCIEGTHYMLIEFSRMQYPAFCEEIFYQLRLRGITPILAHAERYSYFQEDPNLLLPLVEAGALVQVTAASLLDGGRVQRLALALFRHGLAHLVASDTHSPDARPPRLADGLRRIEERIDRETAERVLHNAVDVFADRAGLTEPAGKMKTLLGTYF